SNPGKPPRSARRRCAAIPAARRPCCRRAVARTAPRTRRRRAAPRRREKRVLSSSFSVRSLIPHGHPRRLTVVSQTARVPGAGQEGLHNVVRRALGSYDRGEDKGFSSFDKNVRTPSSGVIRSKPAALRASLELGEADVVNGAHDLPVVLGVPAFA